MGKVYPSSYSITSLWLSSEDFIHQIDTSVQERFIAYLSSSGIDPCRNVSCDFYSICVPQKNTNAVCQCPQICTADWNPVCGSDNETYPNLCMMKVQSCENQKIITKKSDGECGKT